MLPHLLVVAATVLISALLGPSAPTPALVERAAVAPVTRTPGTGQPVPSESSSAAPTRWTAVAEVDRVEDAAKAVEASPSQVRVVRVRGTRHRPAGEVTAPPRVRARAWAVVDMSSGHILGKHRARTRLPQASTIKLLTALTARDRVRGDRPVRATRMAANTMCSCAGVLAGRRYTRNMLLSGMLVSSGNDAAEALAGADPHGRRRFVRAMNNTARRLGATDTVARNPSGLDAPGAHSSARDLLVFLRAAADWPAARRWLDRPATRFGTLRGPRHRLVATTDYMHRYGASYAAKNGYTSDAKNTLTVATRIRGRSIGVAVLGADSAESTAGARALTLWAARNADTLRPVGKLPNP